MGKLVNQSKLPQKELAICRRLGEIRKNSDLSQASFAKELGIPVGSVSNYEYGKTALRADIALRACYVFLANERWLATGEGDWQPCVDLFSELSVVHKLKRGELFSDAYARVLASEHDRLELLPNDQLVMRLLTNSYNTPERLHRIFIFTEEFFRILHSFYRIQAHIRKSQLLEEMHSAAEIKEMDEQLNTDETEFLRLFYRAGISAALDFFKRHNFDIPSIIPTMRESFDGGKCLKG